MILPFCVIGIFTYVTLQVSQVTAWVDATLAAASGFVPVDWHPTARRLLPTANPINPILNAANMLVSFRSASRLLIDARITQICINAIAPRG
jgi:hypothetical protein